MKHYSDEALLDYLEAGEWKTVAWKSQRHPSRSLLQGLVSRGQLQRLSKRGLIRVRTLTASYWLGSYTRDEPSLIIQATLK